MQALGTERDPGALEGNPAAMRTVQRSPRGESYVNRFDRPEYGPVWIAEREKLRLERRAPAPPATGAPRQDTGHQHCPSRVSVL